MKKYLLSLAVIFSFVGYALRGQLGKLGQDDEHVISAPNLNSSNTNQTSNVNVPTNDNTSSNLNTNTSSVTTGRYKDGQYTGIAADAYYGYVQVRANISGGQLTDVQVLRYPNDRQNSIAINGYALPILRSEAIQAQSAQVDVVSGATDTSYAFQQSLQSALSQA